MKEYITSEGRTAYAVKWTGNNANEIEEVIHNFNYYGFSCRVDSDGSIRIMRKSSEALIKIGDYAVFIIGSLFKDDTRCECVSSKELEINFKESKRFDYGDSFKKKDDCRTIH